MECDLVHHLPTCARGSAHSTNSPRRGNPGAYRFPRPHTDRRRGRGHQTPDTPTACAGARRTCGARCRRGSCGIPRYLPVRGGDQRASSGGAGGRWLQPTACGEMGRPAAEANAFGSGSDPRAGRRRVLGLGSSAKSDCAPDTPKQTMSGTHMQSARAESRFTPLTSRIPLRFRRRKPTSSESPAVPAKNGESLHADLRYPLTTTGSALFVTYRFPNGNGTRTVTTLFRFLSPATPRLAVAFVNERHSIPS